MRNRSTQLRIAPIKLEAKAWPAGKTVTLIALGNLVKIDSEIRIWCLFCDTDKRLHESLEKLSLMAYFPLGSQFCNGHLINSHTVRNKYECVLHKDKTRVEAIPERLIPCKFSGLQGGYQNQQFIKVRNKQLLLSDVLIRLLCPDPAFGKITLNILSQAFIFRNTMADDDHLHVELENIYPFHLSRAVARQLILLAGSEDYKDWQRGVAIYAGEALASSDGGPWHCPLPDFKVRVHYAPVNSRGSAPVYPVARAVPELSVPFRKLTIHSKGRSQTIRL